MTILTYLRKIDLCSSGSSTMYSYVFMHVCIDQLQIGWNDWKNLVGPKIIGSYF